MEIKNELLRKTVDFGNGRIVVLNMAEDLKIEATALAKEYTEQALKFGYLAVVAEMSRAKCDELDHELDLVKSQKYHKLKGGDYQTTYGYKPTEDGLKAAVKTDEHVVALQSALNRARHDTGILYAFKNAFEQRKEMLISLGATQRQEDESARMGR